MCGVGARAKAAAARQGHAAARPLLEVLTAMAPQRLSVHHVHVFDGAGMHHSRLLEWGYFKQAVQANAGLLGLCCLSML